MTGVDNRIVTMKFDNREFERSAATSLSTLQKLKESMNFGSIAGASLKGISAIGTALGKIGKATPFAPLVQQAQKGLGFIGGFIDRIGLKNPFSNSMQGASDMQRAAQEAAGPAGMGALEGGITAVSGKFLALTTIALTALSRITNSAITAGTNFAKSFTVAPILDGLHEYETNLKSLQTVQANTDRPLPEIENALQQLNKYSDQTIYNFSEMARNVGTFTAAGVDLETSVSSIKGIANLAALSGSSSEQAATAMYQLSQAIAAGRVGLMDWNSVVNAGMGGKKLQNALAQTAIAMGEIDAKAVKMVGPMQKLTINGKSFRESIMAQPGEETWLTSEALVNTLATMDGRFSTAALKAELTAKGVRKYTDAQIAAQIATARTTLEQKNGVKYTDEQFAALQKMSTSAFKAATEVKTLGQVFEVAKETLASGWSASFKNIFGDLDEAKTLFTGMSRGLNQIINDMALSRNRMLSTWNERGGRDVAIKGLTNAWHAVKRVIGAISDGFRDIFPKKTVGDLMAFTRQFVKFTKTLIPGKDTLANIRDIAGGVFAAFHIGMQIVGGIVDGFKALFDALGVGNGNFLDFAAGVGNSIKSFDKFLEKSGIITAFFEGIGKLLSIPLTLLRNVAEAFANVFGGFDEGKADGVVDAISNATDKLGGLEAIGERVQKAFEGIFEFFGNIGEFIGNALVGIGDVIASALTSEAFSPALDAVNAGLLAAITTLLVKFFTGGVDVDLTGGLFDGVVDTLSSVTSTLTTMQQDLKANIILKIGIAIGVLAASLVVLSTIDPGALRIALAAMAAGMGLLIAAMAVMMKVMGPVGVFQIYAVATAMTKMALAILLLSLALKTLSGIKFGDMLRGLVGLMAMMAIMQKTMIPLAAGAGGMLRAGSALILVAFAMNLLALSLKIFATMSWEEMAQGLAGVTGALLGIALGMQLMPVNIPLTAAGILILSFAMNALAVALKIFATMSWEEMAKGLVTLAGALLGIALGMQLMPPTLPITAVGLLLVANAMVILAGALKIMGSMGWEEIAKGMVVLAGSMIILAVGLNAIGAVGTIGAVGLLAAAAALAVFAPVMLVLGAMDWMSILKSLTALAGIFVVLGVAGYLLAPVVPVIIGLGAALLLLGAGIALAGVGVLALATAFGILAAAGVAGVQVLAHIIATLIAAIPPALKAFGEGIVAFAQAIGEGAPAIAKAFGEILSNILDQIIQNSPKVAKAFLAMLRAALKVITQATPMIVNAGIKLILAFLRAIDKNIGKIVDIAASIIVKFISGVIRNMPKIIQKGVDLVLAFMRGIAKAIRDNDTAIGFAGADIGLALVEGCAKAIGAAAGRIKDAALQAAEDAWNAVKDFFGIGSPSKLMEDTVGYPIVEGWTKGISDNAHMPVEAVESINDNLMSRMSRIMSGVESAFDFDPNFNPTITPVLDLSALTQEANKLSSILAVAPIIPTVSYQTAADISAMTQAAAENDDRSNASGNGEGGDHSTNLTLELHSPKPIDSVEAYRGGKTLISLAKEALK